MHILRLCFRFLGRPESSLIYFACKWSCGFNFVISMSVRFDVFFQFCTDVSHWYFVRAICMYIPGGGGM